MMPPSACVIIVLGSPNDDEGRLYSLARERCELAARLHRARPGSRILLTGGFGEHFNRTDRPHADYTRAYLLSLGVAPEAIVPEAALSLNTLEDAGKALPLVRHHGFRQALVVTSDFHLPRARFIFRETFRHSRIALDFAASDTDEAACPLDLDALKAHERRALAKLEAGEIRVPRPAPGTDA